MIGLTSAPEQPEAQAELRAILAALETERATRVEQMLERWPHRFPPADGDDATVSLPDELWVHIFRLVSTMPPTHTAKCIVGGRTLMQSIPTVCRR